MSDDISPPASAIFRDSAYTYTTDRDDLEITRELLRACLDRLCAELERNAILTVALRDARHARVQS